MSYKFKDLGQEKLRSLLIRSADRDKRVLFIPAVGDCHVLYLPTDDNEYIQYLVDGPFETASMTNATTIWMCENAKMVGRYPVNFRATRIALALRPNWCSAIVGDVFVSGSVAHGFRSINDKKINEIKKACNQGDLSLLRTVDPNFGQLLGVYSQYEELVMGDNVIDKDKWWTLP